MTWVRYGTDDVRDKWYFEEQQKCSLFNERVEVAKKLYYDALDINDTEAYKIMDLENITNGKLILQEAQKYNIPNPTFKKSKDFLSTSLISDRLNIDSPFIKLATDKKVIATISKYMGHIPLLSAIELWHSRYYNDKITASQLWHCDWENPRSMKIFVNISDVKEKNGPFTFIPANKSKIIRDAVKYTYGEPGYRINDKDMDKYCGENEMIKIIGKEKLLFVDSCRCFHFGSRVEKNAEPRILLLLKYLSPASINLQPSMAKNAPFSYLVSQTNDIYSKYVFGYYKG